MHNNKLSTAICKSPRKLYESSAKETNLSSRLTFFDGDGRIITICYQRLLKCGASRDREWMRSPGITRFVSGNTYTRYSKGNICFLSKHKGGLQTHGQGNNGIRQ
ncbi:hypothetical protein SK128_000851 [Halocaridina rubra]|uniref:Uncharacterized protein n=1 Tax=Halocaridina rubra TaxID=373956 RepID=A0AAN9AHJ3_HALRR